MSFAAAARELGVAEWRVHLRLDNGDLVAEDNAAGEHGVTRTSVLAEQQWQRNATLGQRARRFGRYTVSWLLEVWW